MTMLVAEELLPNELNVQQAVEIAYAETLATIHSDLSRQLPVLVECDKDLVPWLYIALRGRLKSQDRKCLFLDGRSTPPENGNTTANTSPAATFVGTMIQQLRDAVRGAVEQRVVVLPHLDLLTTSQGGLTSDAREVIPLLYENPDLVWLGFKDPSFPIPDVIENLFPKRYRLSGLPREKLPQLITQGEARKFGRGLRPWSLYKYVSGMHAARLRRVLSTIEGEDYPANPAAAIEQIRRATLDSTLEIPQVDLETQVGGYQHVKQRLQQEILDVLLAREHAGSPEEIQRLEALIPRGMIFWGPPGTGKTLFAKAMATALGAAITIVSGPELKSRWVGASEENLRLLFHRARQSAPAIIVFDELDSFAAARGTYTGSGVEHSMVNQLLTEMDGFHSEELVFVIGTTNYLESLDPALLRPGRFEFQLQIPYPDRDDREEILKIHDRDLQLQMTPEAMDYAIRRTGEFVEGAIANTRFSGDHLNALCRAIARVRLREQNTSATIPTDIDRALTEWIDRPAMTAMEQQVAATHEAGHAICALFCEHAAPIERISIDGHSFDALGYVQNSANKYLVTQHQLLDHICVLLGGRESERLLCENLSIGSADDIQQATRIARALVEELGMGGEDLGLECYESTSRRLSQQTAERLDNRVREILSEASRRAAQILAEHKTLVCVLRDLLMERKVIDTQTLQSLND